MSTQRLHPNPLILPEILIHFTCRIKNSYPNERKLFITNFCKRFIQKIDQINNKQQNNINSVNNNNNNDNNINAFFTDQDLYDYITNNPLHNSLYLFLPYIIHQRFMSPFCEIQQLFDELIQYISKNLHIQISNEQPPYPLSGFLELSSIKLPFESNDIDDISKLYTKLYTQFGRISHLSLILNLCNIQYLNDFMNLYNSLMYESNGPLEFDKRQYLGLMGASRYSCKPLITQSEQLYIRENGDITWIKSGINNAPIKYQKLLKMNAMLAHQPWLIKEQHIQELINYNWTISEIIQSFIILITYHFLSGLYQGICITPEIDQYYSLLFKQSSNTNTINTNDINYMLSPTSAVTVTSADKSPVPSTNTAANANNDAKLDDNNSNDNDDDEEQRAKNIITLLSQTQQELLLGDEKVVGSKKSGFDHCACLNLDLDMVSDPTNVASSSGLNVEFKFRQLSNDSSIEDDNDSDHDISYSMDFDPNMAPPSLSNISDISYSNTANTANTINTNATTTNTTNTTNTTSNTIVNNISTTLATVAKPKPKPKGVPNGVINTKTNCNGNTATKQIKDADNTHDTDKSEPALLTSKSWRQLISLRKLDLIPIVSDPSITTPSNSNKIKNNLVTSSTASASASTSKTVSNGNIDDNNSTLAKITNKNGRLPHSNTLNKSSKQKKKKRIIPPKSQGITYWKYSGGVNMKYCDFDVHKNDQIHCFDFNWKKHGYACISRYYPGIEKKMDDVFNTAYNMTENQINNFSNIDTKPFRIAIWHYTFRLYGVNNDSYDYRNVNVYLPVKLKIFIKKLVCYSQIVTVDDVKRMGIKLQEKEKIHVAILALEAKKQASLLFALRAIMRYMQSPST